MKILRPIHSNAGLQAYYRRRLLKELEAMQKSIYYCISSVYKKREAEIVGDASPFRELFDRLMGRIRRWLSRWNIFAEKLGEKVVKDTVRNTETTREKLFFDMGFNIKFQESRKMNDTTRQLINENVNLIKKIPQQYLREVEEIVTRGLTQGHDFGGVAKELGRRYDITKRRAAMIARDQIDKATQACQRTRDLELGITEGIWVHLPGQFTSRETHVDMDGKRFRLDEGIFDPAVAKKIKPGQLPLCRCTYRPIIPEFGDDYAKQ